ncbi:unnamed protein product [Staurois parvus]|uniref:Uncharacterized protein n=1 Tax=Staurois parvus TaxID=386267 RepID=A0ABN9GZJ0_9NEOB|nr:unnamed protein product [Staurois parvus]
MWGGGRTVCKQNSSLLSAPAQCFAWLSMQSSVLTVKHSHSPVCKTAHC